MNNELVELYVFLHGEREEAGNLIDARGYPALRIGALRRAVAADRAGTVLIVRYDELRVDDVDVGPTTISTSYPTPGVLHSACSKLPVYFDAHRISPLPQ